MAPDAYVLGIDIGGTFTDMVLLHTQTSEMLIYKCLTTPANPAEGVMQGLTDWFEQIQLPTASVASIIHATTLITNSLIEGKGATTGLLTTQGCRDILAIGRESRYDLYDLNLELPTPLVPRRLRREVTERMRNRGEVYTPLDVDEVKRQAAALVDAGVQSLAVCFLHAHVNDQHERQAGHLLAQLYPDVCVSLSSAIAREIGEYERTSTTVVNAYVQPLAQQYLGELQQRLRGFGLQGELAIMLSSGGVTTVQSAGLTPVKMIESGPAAGALAGRFNGLRKAVGIRYRFRPSTCSRSAPVAAVLRRLMIWVCSRWGRKVQRPIRVRPAMGAAVCSPQ
jgi:N-methylhydantoinase A/oxoprolinase/acetone carboxylase beta subunit